MKALEIEHFSKSYGNTIAVDDMSLSIEQGQFFGFLGPNGAGKTTTIQCTTGISSFTEGFIKVFGVDVRSEYKIARTHIGLSPQEFNVDIFASVEKILWYVGGYYGVPRKKRRERVDDLLTMFDLKKHAEKEFRQLSGGLKRRVMLARAMVHDPDLLILDEPTAGVDIELRHELWKYLRQMNQNGKTIILTSHYLEEVELLCNEIAIIYQGKIVKQGALHDIKQNGKTLEQTYLEITQSQVKQV